MIASGSLTFPCSQLRKSPPISSSSISISILFQQTYFSLKFEFTLSFWISFWERKLASEKNTKDYPFAHFWVKFSKSHSCILYGIPVLYQKRCADALGPDDGNRLIDLLVFLNPEIAHNLQSNHPNLNSVSKNVLLTEFQMHFTNLDSNYLLKKTPKAIPFALF